MAVLPSADTAIQIDDNQPRRQGIGAWNPGIIGQAAREESSGLERLGNSISSVTSEIGDQASQVQYSQAIGQANADLTVAHGKLPGTTDPSQILSADPNTPAPSFQELGSKINAARSMISSPKLQAQFDATMAPHIANFGVQSQARGRELNNQNGVASLETNTTTVISNAAALDDEGAATRALDGVQAQIAPLVSSGAMTQGQAVTFRKGVAEQFVTARHDYLLAQVEAQPPGQRDYSKLNAFSAAHGLGPIDATSGAAPAGGGVPSTSPGGTGSGKVTQGAPGAMSPSGGPWIKGADGKTYATDGDGNVDSKIQPISAVAAGKVAGPGAPSAPAAGQDQAAGALRHYEGLRTDAYWDVNHWRVGYGSDTITKPDGSIESVSQGTKITPADAERDLQRRVTDTQAKIITQVSPQAWGALDKTQQAAITSMGYNYGTLPQDVTFAIRGGGGPAAISAAIANHEGDNGGVNRQRRADEARAVNGGVMPTGLPVSVASLQGPKTPIGHVSPMFQAAMGNPGFTDAPVSSAATQVASLGPVGLPVQPPLGMLGPEATIDDASASAASRAPPQSQWPAGATSVTTNADGTISYKMSDGTEAPVPGSRATGAPHARLPMPPQGGILSLLPPDKRAALQLRTVQEVRRMQREDAMFNQKDDRADLASIGNTVKQMESGIPLGDTAWAPIRTTYSAPDASPQVKYAFAVADATRNVINGFKYSSPADVATAIDNMRADYAKQINNPATAAQSGVLKAVIDSSQNYLKAYEQGVNKNPIGRAAMQGVIGGDGDAPVKTLDPTSPTFGQDVIDRVHQAQVAANLFKQTIPTYLQPEERQALRKVAQAGGEPMVNLAKGVAGAGPDAYEMFKQIGKGAPQLAQIGQWALDPNADHSDQIRRYADQIQIMNNPDLAKHSPQITDNDMRKSTMGVNPLGDAASAFPLTDAARMDQTANVLASEAAANAHIDPKAATFGGTAIPPEMIPNSYHEAVGGTKDPKTGVWFGGLAKVGGSSWRGVAGGYNAIVPTNMRQDQFETALGQVNQSDVDKMGPPPFGGSGKLSAEDIKKGQFVAVPDKATGLFGGRYQVKLPDPTQNNNMQPVRDSSGKPWIFDMNRAQANGLDQRVPGAFKGQWHSGGTPSGPVIPAPHGSYQNVKGVDLSPDVASSEAPSEE